MNRPELSKLIDACRDEADLQLPEFQPLAEAVAADPAVRETWNKSRRFDEALHAAIRDVPIPPGLEDRLVQKLAAADIFNSSDTDSVSSPEQAISRRLAPPTSPASGRGDKAGPDSGASSRRGRRTWTIWTVAAGGVAAALALLFTVWPSSEPTIGNELEAAVDWIGMLNEANWSTQPVPFTEFPPASQLTSYSMRWQQLPGQPASVPVVCYELRDTGPYRALLFVARSKPQSALPSLPPQCSFPSSPWYLGAWRGASVVYVLAVHGDASLYRRLVQPPNPRFASLMVGPKSFPIGKS